MRRCCPANRRLPGIGTSVLAMAEPVRCCRIPVEEGTCCRVDLRCTVMHWRQTETCRSKTTDGSPLQQTQGITPTESKMVIRRIAVLFYVPWYSMGKNTKFSMETSWQYTEPGIPCGKLNGVSFHGTPWSIPHGITWNFHVFSHTAQKFHAVFHMVSHRVSM